jgi:ankyrin repeat protein
MISVTRHIFSIVKYKGVWKYCDNHNIYDFNMDEFMEDFYDPKIEISHTMSKGLFKIIKNRGGMITYKYYSTNLPERIKSEPLIKSQTSLIESILRVVEHDASKLSFRKALYNLLPGPPENTNVIYVLQQKPPIVVAIERGDIAEVRRLILNGVNIDMIYRTNATPLIEALDHGNEHAAALLIDYGCYAHEKYASKNPIIEARLQQIKDGGIITDTLRSLYDANHLTYTPPLIIKQYYKNLDEDARILLCEIYRKFQKKFPHITQEQFNKMYDFYIHTDRTTTVISFRGIINNITAIQGAVPRNFIDFFSSDEFRSYAPYQSSESKYLKYAIAESKRLGDIFHKKYIMYDESENSHPNFEKDFKSLYQKYKQKYLQLKAISNKI